MALTSNIFLSLRALIRIPYSERANWLVLNSPQENGHGMLVYATL